MNKKKYPAFLSWAVYVLIIIITLEIAPFILSPLLLKQGFHRGDIQKEIALNEVVDSSQTTASEDNKGAYLGEHLLHPYLGYVHIPGDDYNAYGFPGPDPLKVSDSNTVLICITGGSVAKQFYQREKEYFIKNLKANSRFAGKEIKILVFALGGFKQPQQLLCLNYFMAQGFHPDYVLNLDGFNEIVLPLSDNHPFGVNPSFPRHWNIYSKKKLDSRVMKLMGRETWIREKRNNARMHMHRKIWRFSNLALFIWKISDLKYQQELARAEQQLRDVVATVENDYQSTGPTYDFTDSLSFLNEQAKLWSRSSKQLADLVEGDGGHYIHFLQANQYDEGSKPLSDEEMNIAYESGSFAYKTAARMGYPLLRKQGAWLIEHGVHFVDLSLMFVNDKRTVYNDKCCHFNALGYRLIADRMLKAINEE